MALSATEPEAVSIHAADPSRGVALGGIVLVVLVLVAELTTHLVDYGVYQLRVRVMDANLGSSPVAWISPAAVAVALVAAILLARRGRVHVLLPAALGVVLVLTTRHVGESLPHWQLLLLPPLGVALFLLWRGADGLDALAARMCRVGCMLLVSAFVLHVFGGPGLHRLGVHDYSWPYQVKVALKEGSEIAGWLLVASGLAATAWGCLRAERAGAGTPASGRAH